MASNEVNVNTNSTKYAQSLIKRSHEEIEQLNKFESIFNRLDTNEDGTINSDDNISAKDSIIATSIERAFNALQESLGTACEFTMNGIKTLLSLVEGTSMENLAKKSLINDNVELDENLYPDNEKDIDARERESKEKDIFNRLDKNDDGIINEMDDLSDEETTVGLNFIKDTYSNKIQNTKDGKYNGVEAQITYNTKNEIIAVKTNATNALDAAKKMGLDKSYTIQEDDGTGYKEVTLYYHDVKNEQGQIVKRDCFRWDENSQSMVRR